MPLNPSIKRQHYLRAERRALSLCYRNFKKNQVAWRQSCGKDSPICLLLFTELVPYILLFSFFLTSQKFLSLAFYYFLLLPAVLCFISLSHFPKSISPVFRVEFRVLKFRIRSFTDLFSFCSAAAFVYGPLPSVLYPIYKRDVEKERSGIRCLEFNIIAILNNERRKLLMRVLYPVCKRDVERSVFGVIRFWVVNSVAGDIVHNSVRWKLLMCLGNQIGMPKGSESFPDKNSELLTKKKRKPELQNRRYLIRYKKSRYRNGSRDDFQKDRFPFA
ncbi:hypothetical protein CEXT_763281 [Caerostris extrusa]|uniref:Uncharacterized protein n=1 Tax=Caerostris extrusa TaxID=172846 RepID=A0AAV4X7D3_CAEEX|nr:hypothetical protein CEXT_763281 [Caerostris extrusa]